MNTNKKQKLKKVRILVPGTFCKCPYCDIDTSQLNAFNTSLLVYSNDMILKTLNTHS